MGFQLGGLISGLDTRSLIDQLMSIERQPINNLLLKKSKLNTQVETYQQLNTKLAAVQSKAEELTRFANVVGRQATSSNTSKVEVTVRTGAAVGSFGVNVSQLASSSTLVTSSAGGGGNGIGGIGKEIGVADLALTIDQINADNRLNTDVSVGTITVASGAGTTSINVTGTKTLGDLLDEIRVALGASAVDVVTNANYVTFTDVSGMPAFGNAGDTSNLLAVLGLSAAALSDEGLGAGGANDLQGSRVLGAVRRDEILNTAGANLDTALTGGSFTINGSSIAFNPAEDTLQDIIDRINGSTAGVRAAYNDQTDQITLTNVATGASVITREEGVGGNFLTAMGLLNGTATIGNNATYTITGDPTIYTSTSNTINNPAGKSDVTLNFKDVTTSTVTITVSGNHDKVTQGVKDFIEAFNSALTFIDEVTLYDEAKKKKAVLQFDPIVLGVKEKLLNTVNTQLFGLSSGNSKGALSELGITTGAAGDGGTNPKNRLELEDATKLWDALDDNPNRVAEMFGALEGSRVTGYFKSIDTYLDGVVGAQGFSKVRQTSGKNQVTALDQRIARLEALMADRRARYEKKFLAMEQAMLRSQTQQGQLNSFFLKAGLSGG